VGDPLEFGTIKRTVSFLGLDEYVYYDFIEDNDTYSITYPREQGSF
jgi:hypothetical protein